MGKPLPGYRVVLLDPDDKPADEGEISLDLGDAQLGRPTGLMVRYAVGQCALSVEQLKGFDLEGYQYVAAASEPDRLVFRREPQR